MDKLVICIQSLHGKLDDEVLNLLCMKKDDYIMIVMSYYNTNECIEEKITVQELDEVWNYMSSTQKPSRSMPVSRLC